MTKEQINGIMSSKSDHWATPKDLLKKIKYDTDICPLHCEVDNLIISWQDKGVIYCNPPYSQISKWVDKILLEVEKGVIVKLLIPARTDTKYFHKLLNSGFIETITFFKGRLRFNEKLGAPFPSILIELNYYSIYYETTIESIDYKNYEYNL